MSELAAAVASLGVDDEDPRIATLRPDDVVAYALHAFWGAAGKSELDVEAPTIDGAIRARAPR